MTPRSSNKNRTGCVVDNALFERSKAFSSEKSPLEHSGEDGVFFTYDCFRTLR